MKCSDTEYNGSPWEWRPLGVAALGSGGPWEWRPVTVYFRLYANWIVRIGVLGSSYDKFTCWAYWSIGKLNCRI